MLTKDDQETSLNCLYDIQQFSPSIYIQAHPINPLKKTDERKAAGREGGYPQVLVSV